MGGEVGHFVLDPHGPPCPCGQRGCYEIYCGGLNVANRLRERITGGKLKTAILDEAGGDPAKIDFKCLVAAVRKKDALALEAWDEYLERLAQGMGTIMMVANPEAVILGTIAIHAGDLVLEPVRKRVAKYAWKAVVEPCRIIPSALESRIGDLSAIAVAIEGLGK
jgi:glucokinase